MPRLTTLAAQLASLPVLVTAFGAFSLVAIPANVLTLSLLPITMFSGFVLAVCGFMPPSLLFFAAKFAGLIVGYQLAVIYLFAKIAIPLPLSFNTTFAFFIYYLVLATFIFSYARRD